MNDPLQVAALFYRTASDHVVAVQHSGNGQPILTNLGTEQLFQMTSKIILHEVPPKDPKTESLLTLVKS